ncbi:MAG TPA: thiamine-phosphate kinase [Bryobacteraceae bacterium]
MIELDLVEWLRKHADTRGSRLVLGIGDDCAIFRPRPGEDLLFTTDQLIEDVHFLGKARAESVGERALARSLSDISAMGGEPRFCLVSLAAPKRKGGRWLQAFFRGLLRLARRTQTPLAGGDLSHDDKVRCDVMVCGAVARGKALRRDGARPGDDLYVSGRLGKPWDLRIQPRLALGQALVGCATSCIDLSDGLSLDLHRLCTASRVAAQLERVPIHQGATLDRALHGGEDYELLFTLPHGKPSLPRTTRIGTIVRGAPGAVSFEGRNLKPRGYDHFT